MQVLRTFRRCLSRIAPAEYAQRRSALIETLRESSPSSSNEVIVVLRGSTRTFYAPDVPYVFRQRSSFRYLTGVCEPGAVLLLHAKGSKVNSFLAVPQRTDHEKLWDGAGTSEAVMAENVGGLLVSELQLLTTLDKLVKKDTLVSFEPTDFKSEEYREMLSRSAKVARLRDAVHRIRWRKSPAELEIVRETTRIGAEAMNCLIQEAPSLKNERAAVGLLEWEWRRRGADGQAYPPVVAAGDRANTIHYLESNQEIPPNVMILVDAGCDLDGYVSDITRSFPTSGEWTNAQLELYGALNEVQSRLLQRTQSDAPFSLNDLYTQMIDDLAAVLKEVGVFSSSLTSRELTKAAEEICPHHVSHYLGMDVHDCASVSRNEKVKPGVVFTVEPGIYVRETNALARPEFRGIGLRIEDDVLKTETGAEVLTAGAVREVADIEMLMRR